MRGADTFTESLFTMRRLEDFVPANHPLRPIRAMVNEALLKMDDLFAGIAQSIGKLFSSSFEIAPAAGLYVIAASLALSLFLAKSRVLLRVNVSYDKPDVGND